MAIEGWVTTKQAADLAGCSASRVRTLVSLGDKGPFPGTVKLGHDSLIPRDQVEAWLRDGFKRARRTSGDWDQDQDTLRLCVHCGARVTAVDEQRGSCADCGAVLLKSIR